MYPHAARPNVAAWVRLWPEAVCSLTPHFPVSSSLKASIKGKKSPQKWFGKEDGGWMDYTDYIEWISRLFSYISTNKKWMLR